MQHNDHTYASQVTIIYANALRILRLSICKSVVDNQRTCVVFRNDLPTDLAAAAAWYQHAVSYAAKCTSSPYCGSEIAHQIVHAQLWHQTELQQ
jgi:hypothetical protein